jgi:non-canonical poly(A) RNA polymerase PAPD5/7
MNTSPPIDKLQNEPQSIAYNLEIPISFLYNNTSSPCTLGSFVEYSQSPQLFLDLTNTSYQKEIELNELSKQLTDKNDQIKQIEKELQESEKQIKEYTMKLKEKDANLNYYESLEITNETKIQELTLEKNTLLQSIQGNNNNNKVETVSKKNLPFKEYIETKFHSELIDDMFIIKTLTKDLTDYRQYILNEINDKKTIIEQIYTRISQLINENLPDFTLHIFGSYATNLSMPWSPLDLVLVPSNNNNNNQINIPLVFQRLPELFYNQAWICKTEFVEINATLCYSILTKRELGSMIVNISINTPQHNGMQCVDLINSYIKEYTILEPIVIALKTILKNANLNDPLSGGLSSYGLILMVVSYIQSLVDKTNEGINEEYILGKTFYELLQHYGIIFDYNNYVILTYPLGRDAPEQFDNMSLGNVQEFIIVDPLNNQNNVAKSNHQFMNLKMAFMIAYMVTKEDCECGCHYGKAVREFSIGNVEHCILKRMFNSVKRFSDSK